MKNAMFRLGRFILPLFLVCATLASAQDKFVDRNCRVRIAVKHEVDHLAIQGSGSYQVVSSGGKPICNLAPRSPYFIEITRGQPGDRSYRLVIGEMNLHQVESAIAFAKQVKDKYQMGVKVLRIPARDPDDSVIIVTIGEFTSQDAARQAVKKMTGESIRYIYEDRTRAKKGQVRLMSRDGSILASDEQSLRLVPMNLEADSIALRELRPDSYSPGVMDGSRHYRGDMELTINEEGSLTAVNDLWVEFYLYSVVAAEIGSDAPDEALKAQAVAARSEAYAKINRGIVSSSFFDFFDTPMFQAYHGKSDETVRVRAAVDATRGEVLVWHGEPADTVYSHCCGGVVASAEDMWDGPNERYEPRLLDRLLDTACPDLTNFGNARKWTAVAAVDALCNPNQEGYPEYAKKYFKWQKRFSGSEVSRWARDAYGTGDVLDILVTRRTPSGRVRELKVVGERKTVTIKREVALRQAFGGLYSNFFTFVKEHDGAGKLARIIIDGAGYGHGVGMCQMGAFMMAKKGYNYRQILAHYYESVRIRRLYR